MARRARQRGRGHLNTLELLAWQQEKAIDVGFAAVPRPREERALRADDERTAVVRDQLLALEQLLRRELAAVVPRHCHRRLGAARRELQLEDAPERRGLLRRRIRQRR